MHGCDGDMRSVGSSLAILPEAKMPLANSVTSRRDVQQGKILGALSHSRAATVSPALASSTTSCEM